MFLHTTNVYSQTKDREYLLDIFKALGYSGLAPYKWDKIKLINKNTQKA